MKVKFGTIPVGGTFMARPLSVVFMKIREVSYESKPGDQVVKRNGVLIIGPDRGMLGTFKDDNEVELVIFSDYNEVKIIP